MAAPQKPTKINLANQLKNVKPEDIMPDGWDKKANPIDQAKLLADLQKEFDKAGLSLERVHNAPLLVQATHGVDIYKVIDLLQQQEVTDGADISKN